MHRFRSLISNQTGQALPEFALVLPVLMLILFGVLEFGRAINYWMDGTHLTAEAARYAAVNRKPDPSNAASLQQQIKAQIDTTELKSGSSSVTAPAQVCVSFPNGTSNPGDPVRVSMSFTYKWLKVLKIATVQTPITATSTMRLEAPPTTYTTGCA